MISFGNAASSHSGLIPLKTAYKKRGELLWAIASKKNFINLHSAAFVTVFARHLVHSYKCRNFSKNCSINFFINLTTPRSIANKYTLQVSITLKSEKLLQRVAVMLQYITNFFTRLLAYSGDLTEGLFSKAYHFLKILANCVDSILLHCFYDA